MEMMNFLRKPFIVEAVEITEGTIKEVAALVGRLKYNEDSGDPYIVVDRKKVPNCEQAHIGDYLTVFLNRYRIFSAEQFTKQFVYADDDLKAWVSTLRGDDENLMHPDGEVEGPDGE